MISFTQSRRFNETALRTALFVTISLLTLSCTKNGGSSDQFYFKAVINGSKIEWIVPQRTIDQPVNSGFNTAMYTPGGAWPFYCAYSTDSLYQISEGTSIYEVHPYGGFDDNQNSIDVRFVYSGSSTDAYDMTTLFTNGSKTFGLIRDSCSDRVQNGIVISYYDANNVRWESSWGDQSYNYFEQVNLQDETRSVPYFKKWTARFHCRVYDKYGHYLEMKDCEIYGPVFPY